MVGEAFWKWRGDMGSRLFALGQMALRQGRHERVQVLQELVGSLAEPLLVVVAGEVNAGKSTLINALFGQEIAQVGPLPTTDRVHYYRYGPVPRTLSTTQDLVETELPHAILRQFHIVDTPGANTTENRHEAMTLRFLPRADLVLFVISAANPWSASAWNLLAKIHRDWMKKTVIVLQQADIRSQEEMEPIIEHIHLVSQRYFGRTFGVFPISGKTALKARLGGALDAPSLLQNSGINHLENNLTEILQHNQPRQEAMLGILARANAILEETEADFLSQQQDHSGLADLCQDIALQSQMIHQEFSHHGRSIAEKTTTSLRWMFVEAEAWVAGRTRAPEWDEEFAIARLRDPVDAAAARWQTAWETTIKQRLTPLEKKARTLTGSPKHKPSSRREQSSPGLSARLAEKARQVVQKADLGQFVKGNRKGFSATWILVWAIGLLAAAAGGVLAGRGEFLAAGLAAIAGVIALVTGLLHGIWVSKQTRMALQDREATLTQWWKDAVETCFEEELRHHWDELNNRFAFPAQHMEQQRQIFDTHLKQIAVLREGFQSLKSALSLTTTPHP
jgi:small GTP-binding protein